MSDDLVPARKTDDGELEPADEPYTINGVTIHPDGTVESESVDTERSRTEQQYIDYRSSYPQYPFQAQVDPPLTAVRPYPNVSNPVITSSHVTDKTTDGVADPFLVDIRIKTSSTT
jgi:hypothetical protein